MFLNSIEAGTELHVHARALCNGFTFTVLAYFKCGGGVGVLYLGYLGEGGA